MKILLLEDDFAYRESMKEYLESLGYSVDDFENGEGALDAAFEKRYDLLLLDIRVPGTDGYEIVKALREYSVDTPVIFVTSLTDIQNLSLGYELGCNDYIRKPFDMIELKFRIEQLIKNSCFKTLDNFISLDLDFKFDVKKGILYKLNEIVDLSSKESEVVSFLIQNRGFFVSIETLHERIWENKEVSYSDIRMCIKRIRQKTHQNFIKTKRFVGYKIDK